MKPEMVAKMAARGPKGGSALELVEKLCVLLTEKKELFLQYEEATLALLSCEVEAMPQYITRREALTNEVDEKSSAMEALCAESPEQEQQLREAAEARADFADVPVALRDVFYKGQELRSVVSRLQQSNVQVMERMQMLRAEALENVRQNKDVAKIRKYLDDLNTQPEQGGLHSEQA